MNETYWSVLKPSLLSSLSCLLLAAGCGEHLQPEAADAVSGVSVDSRALDAEACSSPLQMRDTAEADHTVGDGTPESCSEDALASAVEQGGVIRFACGPEPFRFQLTRSLIAPADTDTVLDGEDRILLDGGGTTQLLRATDPDFRTNDHVLHLQRLVLRGGHDAGSDFRERQGDAECAWGYREGGGGAIYTRNVNIHVWGVTFEDNRGPELGPDVAGGAIYALGAKQLIVANSVFRDNSASNGGAIGLLHTSAALYNVSFERNRATGMLANFAGASGCPDFNHQEQGGAGGLGGAFYADGQDPGDTFCGVRMVDNSSGDLGGAVFRSGYWGLRDDAPEQQFTWSESVFERNSAGRGGGAGYLNNALFTIRHSQFIGNESEDDGGALKLTGLTLDAEDLEFSANTAAATGGAVSHWDTGPAGAGSSREIRFRDNLPNDTAGDFPD